jgi:Icc-related predicted phosphoesterase
VKCLLVADLHYDLRKFDWVLAAAAHVDVVVLAGDHLDAGSAVPRPAQVVIVEKYLRRIRERTRLIVSSGNHDLDSRDAHGRLFTRWITRSRRFDVPTDGDSLVIDDTLFTICPWHDAPTASGAIASHLARDAVGRPARWVWVHHAPPDGSPTSFDGRRSFGDEALRAWIEIYQPDLVLSGHIHQSPFRSGGSWADRIGRTWVFNAGHQIGPVPSHVAFDTAEPGAWWSSLAGAEQALLDATPERPFPSLVQPPDWFIAMAQTTAPAAIGRPAESSLPARG